jgi:hypothetical protein
MLEHVFIIHPVDPVINGFPVYIYQSRVVDLAGTTRKKYPLKVFLVEYNPNKPPKNDANKTVEKYP